MTEHKSHTKDHTTDAKHPKKHTTKKSAEHSGAEHKKHTPHKKESSSSWKPAIILLVIVVILGIVAIVLYQQSGTQENKAAGEDQVLVTVNGEAIYQSEVVELASVLQLQYPGVTPDIVINQSIYLKILELEAAKQGVVIDQERVSQVYNEQMALILTQIPQEELDERLQSVGLTRAQFESNAKQAIERDAVIQALLAQQVYGTVEEVDDQQALDFYQANAELFSGEQIAASHILICHQDATGCEQSITREEAFEQIVKVRNMFDGDNFAQLAQQYSTGPSGPRGGDLGAFGRGVMVPEFEEAAFELAVGEISQPVETQFGYHLILVTDDSQKEGATFAQVSDAIKQQLFEQRVQNAEQAYIDSLVQQAEIVYPQN